MAENVAAALENTRERKFRLIKLLQGCVLLPVVKLLKNHQVGYLNAIHNQKLQSSKIQALVSIFRIFFKARFTWHLMNLCGKSAHPFTLGRTEVHKIPSETCIKKWPKMLLLPQKIQKQKNVHYIIKLLQGCVYWQSSA